MTTPPTEKKFIKILTLRVPPELRDQLAAEAKERAPIWRRPNMTQTVVELLSEALRASQLARATEPDDSPSPATRRQRSVNEIEAAPPARLARRRRSNAKKGGARG